MQPLLESNGKSTGYLPYIDGLRAIAVLSVVVYHLKASWLPGGFVGVDVFFVISGFVISGSLDGRGLNTFKEFVSYFYSRRIKRILPALLACVLVTALATVLLTIRNPYQPPPFVDTAIYALFGFSNFALYNSGQDYFAEATELNPFTHTWSLGVEEQFYLLFPFLFYWWARAGATQSQRRLSTVLFAMGLVGSVLLASWDNLVSSDFGFYMLPARFWELACGVLLYQFTSTRREQQLWPAFANTGIALVSVFLLISGFWFSDPTEFPIPWALLPVLGTAGLIVCLISQNTSGGARSIKRFLASKPMLYIGERSYSLYLWHWPVLVLFKWTIGLEEPHYKFAALCIIAALSLASFSLVEKPIRSSSYLHKRTNRFALLAGLACILVGTFSTYFVFRAQNTLSLSITANNDNWYSNSKLITPSPACGGSTSRRENYLATQTDRTIQVQESGCPDENKKTLFVVGDSHAWAYLVSLRTLAANKPVNVYSMDDGGCRFPETVLHPSLFSEGCAELGAIAKAEVLQRAKPGDLLFLPGARIRHLSQILAKEVYEDQPGHLTSLPNDEIVMTKDKLETELRPFIDKGMGILLERPKPVFATQARRCSDWFNRANPACEKGLSVRKDRVLDAGAHYTQSYAALNKEYSQINVWDPTELLCPEEICYAMQGHEPLFYDENHLSWYGNSILYSGLEKQISQLLEY